VSRTRRIYPHPKESRVDRAKVEQALQNGILNLSGHYFTTMGRSVTKQLFPRIILRSRNHSGRLFDCWRESLHCTDWLKQDLEFAESFNASKMSLMTGFVRRFIAVLLRVQYESAESTPTGN